MSRFRIRHTTIYRYESSVSSSYGQYCLLPRESPGQRCTEAEVTVVPRPQDRRDRIDFHGNRVGYFHVRSLHEVLRITGRSTVEIDESTRVPPLEATKPLDVVRTEIGALEGAERVEASQYQLESPRTGYDDRIRAFAARSLRGDRPYVECLADLMAYINAEFDFLTDATQVTSTARDLLSTGAGVCQDFAHLAVACLRAEGIPARYVSGYLETDPPPGKPRVVGADVSHAWASALVPGVGWLDIDPTNDQFINDRYVTVAWGRDYTDVTPVKGVIFSDGGLSKLEVEVDVERWT